MRRIHIAALALALAAPMLAQSPKGWKLRVDRSTSAQDPDAPGAIKFETAGSGFKATNPQAAVYWNPANTASGAYTLKGTFTLLKPSGHNNYYGLVFGGSNLEGPQQEYIYFLVAKTPHDAIKKPGDDGKSVNALEVRVGADKIDYVVNGQVVHSMPKGTLKTDGIWGARVNHLLEVQIDNLAVAK
jgi:hypothetical protein